MVMRRRNTSLPDRYTHVWRVRKFLPDRYGQMCRPVVYGRRLNSALVEFTDGYRVVTLRWFIREMTAADRPRAVQPTFFDN
jgi:hypothetical protein